jgi:hypothetical protein
MGIDDERSLKTGLFPLSPEGRSPEGRLFYNMKFYFTMLHQAINLTVRTRRLGMAATQSRRRAVALPSPLLEIKQTFQFEPFVSAMTQIRNLAAHPMPVQEIYDGHAPLNPMHYLTEIR